MKKVISTLALLLLASSAMAQQVIIQRNEFGSGTPGTYGFENATQWNNDIFFAPQYLPGYPTAAVIFPRVVDVQCEKGQNEKKQLVVACKGYNWAPELGRGEYLMFRITPVPSPEVVVLEKKVPGPTVTIIKEVEVEKKHKKE